VYPPAAAAEEVVLPLLPLLLPLPPLPTRWSCP